jgi:PAP2 superfamily
MMNETTGGLMSENVQTKPVQSLWRAVRLDTPWHHFRVNTPLLSGQAAFVLLSLLFIASGAIFLPNPNLFSAATIVQLLIFSGLSLCFALVAHVTAKFAETRSVAATIDYAFKTLLARRNLARALPSVLLVGVFMFTFPTFKSQIPQLNPFSWDPAIAAFDRTLHFGHAPWELFASLTGYGRFTSDIDHFYYLWFPVIFTTTAAVALIPGHSDARHRYLLSFLLSWIVIGCVLAVAFSSAGPIYFDRLHGGTSEFTALTRNLEAVNALSPLQTIAIRDQLWQAYSAPSNDVISGISAMPSMHNAICVLMFLAARHAGKALAWAAGVFALAIFVGSVHLGWHYASDGYLAAILVACIWKFTGWHVKRTVDPV